MKVVLSIHDITPFYNRELEIILKEFGNFPSSFLVTPMWQGAHLIDKDLAKVLTNKDLVLHGLTHHSKIGDLWTKTILMSKVSKKEFYGLDRKATIEKIESGIGIFEDVFNKRPKGFIPPMWYLNPHLESVLKQQGFDYTESSTRFINLRSRESVFSIPVCFDFGSNRFLNKLSLNGWRFVFKYVKQPLLRFSIHPADIKNGYCSKIKDILHWMKDNEYEFITYNQLIYN